LKPDVRFVRQSKEFWAHVRTISKEVGYTVRGAGTIRIPALPEVQKKFECLKLDTSHIASAQGTPTRFGQLLFDYFEFRANVLNDVVQYQLMNRETAEAEFKRLRKKLIPKCPLPMNKQKGEKQGYAFLTSIVNMLIEANIAGAPCDYDPRSLTTITANMMPLRTLARRVDGAFPSVVNPVAIWEIKEYYNTKTFGSRVADGVYETLLDGMELEELEAVAKRKVYHLLFLDDHFTWWECGRSYLCRMIDILQMGFVDEIIFGREVLKRLPVVAREWKVYFDQLANSSDPAAPIKR
jgi:hypothetical protein